MRLSPRLEQCSLTWFRRRLHATTTGNRAKEEQLCSLLYVYVYLLSASWWSAKILGTTEPVGTVSGSRPPYLCLPRHSIHRPDAPQPNETRFFRQSRCYAFAVSSLVYPRSFFGPAALPIDQVAVSLRIATTPRRWHYSCLGLFPVLTVGAFFAPI
ncbi:hypothetical protein F5Y10DRAFT_230547 [Nemania abortiva]|nr:hypothetical protein F5Y10DRAFT_230547 [Nemania abortiva]